MYLQICLGFNVYLSYNTISTYNTIIHESALTTSKLTAISSVSVFCTIRVTMTHVVVELIQFIVTYETLMHVLLEMFYLPTLQKIHTNN
jgi:hypothetical protein